MSHWAGSILLSIVAIATTMIKLHLLSGQAMFFKSLIVAFIYRALGLYMLPMAER